MSEHLLQWYRPVADALLSWHGLSVGDNTRHMLATTIMHNRVLSRPDRHKRSPRADLIKVRTHAAKLLEYAEHPPARRSSLTLRHHKLAEALRSDGPLLGIHLIFTHPAFDPTRLLHALDDGSAIDPKELRRLLRTLDAIEGQRVKERDEARRQDKRTRGIGRPWAAVTTIVRAGCVAWQRAGGHIQSQWSVDEETLSGALPTFLRDLIACCNGTHEFVRTMWNEQPRRVPRGYVDLKPTPKGDGLTISDLALRDAIRGYREWCRVNKQKIEPFSLDLRHFEA